MSNNTISNNTIMDEGKNGTYHNINTPPRICWVCQKINPLGGLSQCPKNWGMHNNPPLSYWDIAHKSTSHYFPGEITSLLCFDCAH